jgi:hypothetical protein
MKKTMQKIGKMARRRQNRLESGKPKTDPLENRPSSLAVFSSAMAPLYLQGTNPRGKRTQF